MPRARFFKAENNSTQVQHSFINVGGEQFHAAAVALIDYFKRSPRINDDTLKKILERFYFHFPKYIPSQPYLTPSERMSMLINGTRKSEIVECFAYVLRQLAIDEIYAKPLNYRDIFSEFDRNTLKSFLRQPSTPLPTSALRALSHAIGINITLSVVENGKELRKREVYLGDNLNSTKPGITIQVQKNNKYFPAVKNKADFVYVGQLAVSPPKPVESSSASGKETIADVVDLITSDNKKLLQAYKQWYQNFLTMLKLGEITTQRMINLYIKFLPSEKGLVIDSTEFFSRLAEDSNKPVTANYSGEGKDGVNQLLASALAGWISTRQVDVDQLFDHLENRPSSVSMSVG
ncbi:TPA: hypothetical protein ACJ5DT_001415 [Legionella pneumophila]|uniref:Uncharacterized protein n=1 Tax=Legionella pneumophila TaxID=446 RepID=A0A2S6F926_LEGPN|nr:hypothetical protein [Legionella pneumophila]APF04647.1 hypothetical protein BIZ52_15340 [Legionella pneumophila subsp. fraseri]APF07636.1 hypothetical protein BIZ51_15235 [Legionella pneumophila subsp. fraseri]AUB70085.1 hypothetical protein BJK09_15135 [Legionella pneumophila]AUB73060.1 hypothetical protein BJK08_15130 [Legionella pneumophila]KXB24861.1 hypothetical protein PtVF66_10215 [Legionella pneumophila]